MENIAAMRLDVSGLISNTGFGTTASFKRFSGNTTGTGRKSGAWVSYASGSVTLQDAGGTSFRDARGVVDDATHVLFTRVSATLAVENRVVVTGDSYEYDILSVDRRVTHQEARLKRVLRS